MFLVLMFQQLLASKHHRLRHSKFGRVEAWIWSPTKLKKKILKIKNKPQVNHEPRSAHSRAVKNNKPRVEHEPRLAHGRAVKR